MTPQKRKKATYEPLAHFPKSDVRQQHILTHIRDTKGQAHPGPSGERNSHISALLVSPLGLAIVTKWVQLWADMKLDPAFTEPWLQAKVSGGDKRRRQGETECLCEPTSRKFEGRLGHTRKESTTKMEHRRLHGKSTRKCLLNLRKSSLRAISRTGSVQLRWDGSLPTCGQERKRYNQQPGQKHREAADRSR